jgi:hypothetical protein
MYEIGLAARWPRRGPKASPCLFGADRPSLIVSGGILLGPRWKAGTLFSFWILDARSRIDGDVFGFLRPFEQAAHCIKEVAGLCWRCSAAVAACSYVLLRDSADRMMTGRVDYTLKVVFTVAASGER